MKFVFHVKEHCFHPKKIVINDQSMEFEIVKSKYRNGGAVISKNQFLAALNEKENTIKIYL